MTSPLDPDRDVRLTQLALGAALGFAVAALAFALWLRYGPEDRAAAPAAAVAETSPPADELTIVSAAATPADSLTARESAAESDPPAGPPVATDVVLLPCTEPNPRTDGRFLIPPHDPTHRTIVGLPSVAGEPRRGLVIPPHDPGVDSRVTLEIVPLDSVLESTIRLPAHDPARYKLIGPDTLPGIKG
jgi:hypothetical protein